MATFALVFVARKLLSRCFLLKSLRYPSPCGFKDSVYLHMDRAFIKETCQAGYGAIIRSPEERFIKAIYGNLGDYITNSEESELQAFYKGIRFAWSPKEDDDTEERKFKEVIYFSDNMSAVLFINSSKPKDSIISRIHSFMKNQSWKAKVLHGPRASNCYVHWLSQFGRDEELFTRVVLKELHENLESVLKSDEPMLGMLTKKYLYLGYLL